MAHMDPAGGIGEHLQEIVFLPPGLLMNPEATFLLPDPLPLGFYSLRLVSLVHENSRAQRRLNFSIVHVAGFPCNAVRLPI